MDDPGIVRVVCAYDMVEATLWWKTEKDVTNYRREEGAESGFQNDKDNVANEFHTFVHSTRRHVTLPALVYKFPKCMLNRSPGSIWARWETLFFKGDPWVGSCGPGSQKQHQMHQMQIGGSECSTTEEAPGTHAPHYWFNKTK